MPPKIVKTLRAFLKLHKINKTDDVKKQSTHTRIGGREEGEIVYGGNYHIPNEDLDQFYDLYYKSVFIQGNKEYLTETQDIENGGPLLVDIDMRFDSSINTRLWGIEEISGILELYCESLKEIVEFKEDIEFDAYIFEKSGVVMQENKETKDGIHIVFGLHMHHNKQQLLREIVINKEKEEMNLFGSEGLNCLNSPENIFDECISTGRNNWQVWGSRKPGCEAYKLKYRWTIKINDDEFSFDNKDISDMNIRQMLPIISVKNKNFVKCPDVKEKYTSQLEKFKVKKKVPKKKINKKIYSGKKFTNSYPVSHSELDSLINDLFSSMNLKDYHLSELHKLTMILDESYFNPFKEWMEVGWALHNTSDDLFWTWVKFSSKSDKFEWSDIPDLKMKWNDMKDEGFSFRSIHYWSKNLNPVEYKKIHNNSIETLVYKTLPGGGCDTDIAILTKNLFMGEFACTSLVEKKWFQFMGHRWKNSDGGIGLRIKLSQDVEALYQQGAQNEKDKSTDEQYTAAERETFLQNASAFNRITIKLKSHTQKKSIMGECMEQFYNADMVQVMDENKYLLGFENGIYDFEKKIFRQGIPEDYVSFTTKTNYVPFNPECKEQCRIKEEIDDFMEKVFPDPELRQYMWDHAASTLIGENRNQKFIIYTGVGGNGKSIWVDLLNLTLGNYADKMNIALITQKRKSIGGPTPEIAKLKGKRFVSMDEPSAGDELNEGIMKQMTGGDEMEGRGMYAKKMLKFYPQFELVCCTNHLFTIKSTDKGTWRRIRQVDFVAEFVDEEEYKRKEEAGLTDDPNKPIYIKDLSMKDKLPSWVQVFTALLIERVNETGGLVKDCKAVLKASQEYEQRENFWSQFFNENVTKGTNDDKIKKTEIRNHFNDWYQTNYQARPPKASELYEQLTKKYGQQRKNAWYGWKIVYDTYDSDSDDEEYSE